MHPWFLLRIQPIYISLVFAIISIVAYTKGYFITKNKRVPIFCVTMMFLWIAKDANFFGIIEAFINAGLISSLVCLKKEHILGAISYTTKWLAIILLISATFYILFIIGIPLPHSSFALYGTSLKSSLDNYYFFVQSYEVFGFTRFYSVFLEPGYLTLGVAPLLFLQKYNIRNKYVLILLIAQLLSFSLAGIILLSFGFVYVLLCNKERGNGRKMIKALLTTLCAVIIAYNFFGADYFEQTIFRRIEIVDGSLSGDDRSSKYLDSQYESLMNKDSKWIGTTFDVSRSEKGVSGYKLFTVENGIIGLILVLMAYFSLISFRIKLDLRTGEIIICLLLLYQNSYPFASCVLLPAISARYFFIKG